MRSIRPASAGVLVLVAFTSVLIVRSSAGIGASAQSPRDGAAGALTAGQAAPFVGDRAVSVGMNTFEAAFAVAVTADGGKVTATVSAAGQPTVNTLPPTRANFLRITQTDTAAEAPPWSVRNLRVYEAPAAAARK